MDGCRWREICSVEHIRSVVDCGMSLCYFKFRMVSGGRAGPQSLAKKPRSLAKLAGWNIETTNKFEEHLLSFRALPSYKKVLASMIKFSEMYQPIRKGRFQVDIFDQTGALNEERRLRRAQIYMNKRDFINTFDDLQGKRIVVTSRGHKIFYKDYPLAKLRKESWDGNWTVVMYDFPEKIRGRRRYLRDKLMKLGFGCPQISILISPLPLEEPVQKLVEGEKVEDFVWVLTCKRLWGLSDLEVAGRTWSIGELNRLYGKLLEALPRAKKEKGKILEQWKAYFLAVNTADPYLPFELLPRDWVGTRCEKKFVKLGFGGSLRLLLRRY